MQKRHEIEKEKFLQSQVAAGQYEEDAWGFLKVAGTQEATPGGLTFFYSTSDRCNALQVYTTRGFV